MDIRVIAIKEACIMFRMKEDEIRGTSRKKYIVDVRRVITYALRDYGVVYERIGDALNKDHSTVIHYAKNDIIKQELNKKIETLKQFIQFKINYYGITTRESINETSIRYDECGICNFQEFTSKPIPKLYALD